MKKRLVAVQGPVQYVAGYIAMAWLAREANADEQHEDVLVIYDMLAQADIEQEMAEVIRRLAAAHRWKAIVQISAAEMAAMMRGNYEKSKQHLRNALGVAQFDEIYLARDYCGDGSPLIINAYPGARRVIYGDALGVVGCERDYLNFDWRRPVRTVLSRARRRLRRLRDGGPKKMPFDVAVLVLPQDMYGEYLDSVPLQVPSKQFVVDTFARACAQLDDLNAYCTGLLEHGGGERDVVFLLSNLSASGLMSFDNEVRLYTYLIRRHADPGARIFLKSHPRAPRALGAQVVAALAGAYQVVEIDDPRFFRFPIELWAVLIRQCTVVPIFSTSGMNIGYIYDTELILPLNEELIASLFYKDKVIESTTSHLSIVETVKRLKHWDGNSILWNGNT